MKTAWRQDDVLAYGKRGKWRNDPSGYRLQERSQHAELETLALYRTAEGREQATLLAIRRCSTPAPLPDYCRRSAGYDEPAGALR